MAHPSISLDRGFGPTRRWVLTGILIVAAFLRFHHLSARSLWIDEINTLVSAHGDGQRGELSLPRGRVIVPPAITAAATAAPLWTVARPDPDDVHPPLYYLLVRAWMGVWGWTEAGLRSFSVLASLSAIAFLFLVVRELSGTTPALWASLLMALAQPQIEMAQEGRSYALSLAMSLGAAYAAVKITERGLTASRIVAFAVVSLIALFTHYFALSVVGCLSVFFAIRLRGKPRRQALTASAAAMIAFGVLWGPVIARQRHGASGGGTTFFKEEAEGHLPRTAMRAALLPVSYLYTPLPDSRSLSMVFAALTIAPLALFRRRADLRLWAIWLPINVAPTLLVDLLNPTWSLELIRYTLLASPAVYALAGTLTATLRRTTARQLLPAVAALGCVLHLDQAYNLEGQQRQNWRAFARAFDAVVKDGDVCVFATGQSPDRFPAQLFVCLQQYSQKFPRVIVLTPTCTAGKAEADLRQFAGAMVVTDYLATESVLPGWATADGGRMFQGLGRFYRATPQK